MRARRRRRGGGDDSFGTSIADILTTALGCVLLLFLIALTQLKGAIKAERVALEGARQRLLEVSERRDQLLQENVDKDERSAALRAALQEQERSLQAQRAEIKALEARLSAAAATRQSVRRAIQSVSAGLTEGAGARPIDVVLVIDGTSSMEPSLNAVRNNLRLAIGALRIVSPESRVGVTVFRDRREKPSIRLESKALTAETEPLLDFLRGIKAMNTRRDRDRPEWLCGGLQNAMRSRWSPQASRLIIVVSDADGQNQGTPGCVKLARRFHRRGGRVIVLSTKPPRLSRRKTRRIYEQKVLPQHAAIARAGGGEHIREAGPERLLEELLRAAFKVREGDEATQRRVLRESLERVEESFEEKP
ncbi:MAG: VWA domain-containing protein [Myxococcota bacterium]|nr:VWA domain-containing protein [Myxococcota bacterium]